MGLVSTTMSKLPKLIQRIGKQRYTKHDQIVYFIDGSQRYINNVVSIYQNKWTHLITEDHQEFIVNPDKVLYVQRYLKQPDEV